MVDRSSWRGRVLVVDDEPGMRRALKRLLEDDGFDVTTAASGADALGLAAPFDVVICDLDLPGMRGADVASAFERRVPPTPVVLMSGVEPADKAVIAQRRFLTKPIELGALYALLGELAAPGRVAS